MRGFRRIIVRLVPILLAAAATGAGAADREIRIVHFPEGAGLEEVFLRHVEVLDRFPGGCIVETESAAEELRRAGFDVGPPIPIVEGRSVTLLEGATAAADREALLGAGLAILGRGKGAWIVESRGALPATGPLARYERRPLRDRPMRPPLVAGRIGAKRAAPFALGVDEIVARVDPDGPARWIDDLAGANDVVVAGHPFRFATRFTSTASCDTAERYVYERFQALGFEDVAFDPFSFGSVTARNVVATLPGTTTPNHVYILCGHLDSFSGQPITSAPGANDNASGVAVLLAAAEALRGYEFRSTIRFIAFTGEEQGLYGSAHYAAEAAAAGDSILGVVNCDMVSWFASTRSLVIEGGAPWEWLMLRLADACEEYTDLLPRLDYESSSSDHVSFQNEGFPAVLAIMNDYASYPCWHSVCDTAGMQKTDFAADVARACAGTIADLAEPSGLIVEHAPPPRVTTDTAGVFEVTATIVSDAPLPPESLTVRYALAGPFAQATLTPTGAPNEYHALLPAPPRNGSLRYWIRARDDAGRVRAHPWSAPDSLHLMVVVAGETILSEDFENDAPGWFHGGALDDWQVGAPQGLAEDPPSAWSGAGVAGTDLTGIGAAAGRYEPGCDTYLASPIFDASAYDDVQVSFRRHLAVEGWSGGGGDSALFLVNGSVVWASPAEGTIDTGWVFVEYDLSADGAGAPAVFLQWTLRADGANEFGGWNIDDVRVTGVRSDVLTGVATASAGAPPRVTLHRNRPNPFNPSTTIRFELERDGTARLAVYDVTGRLVRVLAGGERSAGVHEATWDGRDGRGRDAPPGTYFFRVETEGGAVTGKMVLVR